MPGPIELPESATLAQRSTYSFLRNFFYFFFVYLAYAPIRRVNKPDLSGTYIWASSHSNFLCDTVLPGVEGPRPTKFLAKSTLFVFPIKGFLEFCGALPLARAEDHKDQPAESRTAQNRSTFRVAIAAMKDGWPIAIYPEGGSYLAPGLTLPLKPGVAKLAFAAEEAADFRLGSRVIPVGLDYGRRSRVASGLTIRYGRPLVLRDYEPLYRQSRDEAVRKMMSDLTTELIHNFPHFEDETKLTLAKKLVALGFARSRYSVAQLFLRKREDDAFWAGLDQRLRAFEEATKGRGIPLPAWGYRRMWKELGPRRRRSRFMFLLLGLPFSLVDIVNSSLPEFALKSLVDYVAVDETEKMSLRFILSPPVLGVMYALQFWFLKAVVFERELTGAGFGTYVLYTTGSFLLWYFGVHWRRQFKRFISLAFFRKAGVDARSEAVAHYRSLRQYLGDLEDHGR